MVCCRICSKYLQHGLRNIEQFKYLAFHDDDEIILPKNVEQYFSK